MESDTPLDYAAFQLSPKHSRCELFVSGNGSTEKLASGLVKPFVTHLKAVEEQVALPGQFIKLEVDKRKNVESWFTKGTLERFVRFVTTPEIVELVSTFDAEMSQLEAARRIYSQGSSDQLSGKIGDGRSSIAAGADATKKELLRAIDVRLTAVKQDLNTACSRAAAAGFNHASVADLQLFAERFGASRLNEACCKYISLYERRPELFNDSSFKSGFGDQAIRCSYSSDMSIDDDVTDQSAKPPNSLSSSASFPLRTSGTLIAWESKEETAIENEKVKKEEVGGDGGAEEPLAQTATQPSSRRLSVQDRINLFENKQKETGSGGKPVVAKPELRRLSSDVSHSNSATPPAVLRRWSGASDMSIGLGSDNKESDSKPPMNETLAAAKTEVQKNQPDLSKVETSSGIQSIASSVDQPNSTLEKTQSWSSFTKSEDDLLEVRVKPHTQIKSDQVEFKPSIVETSHQGSDAGSSESGSEPITLRAPSKNTRYRGGGAGFKLQEAVAASNQRGVEIGSLRSQPRRNYSAETEEVDKKGYVPTEKQFGESGFHKTKFQKNVSRDESAYVHGYSNTPPSGKFVQEGSGSMSLEPVVEQAHRSRQLKGNQELNDELKMKANELEKLFAEHKLRVPGEQPNHTRRSKPSDDGVDQATTLPYRKPVAEPVPNQVSEQNTVFKSPLPVTELDSQNHRDALQRSFSEVGFSDDLRGKFYESYTKKRDERLREQWGCSKSEKEARMKALHDNLERNSAEMKAKLSWSVDRHDPVSSARRRAERLRSFNARSAMKREQPLDFGQLEDEDLSELSEPKPFGNGVSRNVQGKRPLPVKNSSTSTPRTPAAPVPRSATKVASGSGRRRVQSDNPLAQSVPNFSDLRKENTKPYSAAGKAATRSQLRNYPRSRSTNEETPSVKEEKPGRSQSLRKNSPTPPETSEGVILTPLKFDKDHSEGVYTKPKPFLRKNNGTGSAIVKLKASMMSEEEYEPDAAEDDEEEFDTTKLEDQAVVDGTSHKNESLINSESENGDPAQLFSQVDPTLAAGLPATSTSMFPVQDSPGESPMSWNSRTHHPFSYTHEPSDIDAAMESWNLQEADAARMRKKWGSTQKNILVANSSGVQSRKDMTKGFKRLLKFGRKIRGTDNMADWISATTSEGDDDTEDGREVSNRSSEDLRKTRMGYSHGLPFEGSFNESDYFSDQVHTLQSSIPTPPANFRLREDHLSGSSIKAPRSFFSLSSFRSKGSESKPR